MSTLTEIEFTLPSLTTEELVRLDDTLEATLRERRKVFTGLDAVRWWRVNASGCRMPMQRRLPLMWRLLAER
jgi:hypothetical protein